MYRLFESSPILGLNSKGKKLKINLYQFHYFKKDALVDLCGYYLVNMSTFGH